MIVTLIGPLLPLFTSRMDHSPTVSVVHALHGKLSMPSVTVTGMCRSVVSSAVVCLLLRPRLPVVAKLALSSVKPPSKLAPEPIVVLLVTLSLSPRLLPPSLPVLPLADSSVNTTSKVPFAAAGTVYATVNVMVAPPTIVPRSQTSLPVLVHEPGPPVFQVSPLK
jgi:hypothetical protein